MEPKALVEADCKIMVAGNIQNAPVQKMRSAMKTLVLATINSQPSSQ
jgi:hypothetical protein